MMGFKFTEVRVSCSDKSFVTERLQLGAIRFDRDLRSITTYLSSQTAFGDAREKFVRLQQMSTLLNLDSVRVLRFYDADFLNNTIGRRRGRILQRFWYILETDCAGSSGHCFSEGIVFVLLQYTPVWAGR